MSVAILALKYVSPKYTFFGLRSKPGSQPNTASLWGPHLWSMNKKEASLNLSPVVFNLLIFQYICLFNNGRDGFTYSGCKEEEGHHKKLLIVMLDKFMPCIKCKYQIKANKSASCTWITPTFSSGDCLSYIDVTLENKVPTIIG